jgi:hypothetical protein
MTGFDKHQREPAQTDSRCTEFRRVKLGQQENMHRLNG